MTRITRRGSLQLAGGIAAASVLATSAPALATPAYKFVRIDGLAEQEVGERLLMELYKRAGIEISVTALPGARALEQASSGAMDGETLRVFALGENVPALIRMPTPLSSLQTVAFARRDADIALVGQEDLNNYANVVVIGVLHTKAITEGVSSVAEVTKPEAMFRMVQSGRADLALTSLLDGQAWIRRLGGDDLVSVEPALNDQPLYHYVHESKREVIDIIEPIAAEMAASGELAEVRAQLEADYLSNL